VVQEAGRLEYSIGPMIGALVATRLSTIRRCTDMMAKRYTSNAGTSVSGGSFQLQRIKRVSVIAGKHVESERVLTGVRDA